MEKHSYSAASLAEVLRVLEQGYGVSSAEFYRAHVDNDDAVVGTISAAHRQAWAGFYVEWRRMCSEGASAESSFSERIERELELA